MTKIQNSKQYDLEERTLNFAKEALSKKDFLMRIKICRKESKESIYWLKLLETEDQEKSGGLLIREATELTKIFGSIVEKTK